MKGMVGLGSMRYAGVRRAELNWNELRWPVHLERATSELVGRMRDSVDCKGGGSCTWATVVVRGGGVGRV